MKIFWIAIFFLIANATAGSAAPYELKGYALGMTLAEFKQAFKEKSPEGPYCSDDHGSGLAIQPAVPGAVICSPIAKPMIKAGKKSSFGGGPVTLLYQLISESPERSKTLFSILVFFEEKSFKTIKIALTQKYGAAGQSDPMFETWTNGPGKMVLMKKYAGKKSVLFLTHTPLENIYTQRKNKLIAQKALADM